MGTYLNRGVNFTTGDQVTAANLQNLVDNATLATGAADGQTIEITDNTITVANGGISPTKLSTGGPGWDGSSNLTVGGNATITGNTSTTNITASGTANVGGDATFTSGMEVTGSHGSTSGILNVGNPTSKASTVNIDGTLQVTGASSMQAISSTTITCANVNASGTITGASFGGNGSVFALASFTLLGESLTLNTNKFNVTSVARDSSSDSGDVKVYLVTLASAAPNTSYIVNYSKSFGTALIQDSDTSDIATISAGISTTQFKIGIHNRTDTTNVGFSVIAPTS